MTVRAGSSNSSPRRASSYARWPATLMAEWAGGRCWMSPRNCGSAASISARVGSGASGDELDFALDVVGHAAAAEQKHGPVLLRHPLHVLDQPRRLADANYQDAGRQRVERASMAALDGARAAARLGSPRRAT